MALGARPSDVERMVLATGLTLAVAGAIAGTLVFLGLGRVLGALLYGVGPRDPVVIGQGQRNFSSLLSLQSFGSFARPEDRIEGMVKLLASLALAFLWSCSPGDAPAARNQDDASAAPPFVGRAWAGQDAQAPPGALRIFLPDGTLLMDSCFETYRLAEWRMVPGGRLVIVEEGVEIPAEILSASGTELKLRLTLRDGTKEETYRPAPVPYVCPDMPR